MRTTVLSAIKAMMLYSKGGDTTKCHMRYWKLNLFFGMWRVRGLAFMAKSIHALWRRKRKMVALGNYNYSRSFAEVTLGMIKMFPDFSSLHSFLNCSPPSFYPLVPGKWWWWEPQRCSQRRKGRQRSTPRKRWTFPSCNLGSGLGSQRWNPLSVLTPCRRTRQGQRKFIKISLKTWNYLCE